MYGCCPSVHAKGNTRKSLLDVVTTLNLDLHWRSTLSIVLSLGINQPEWNFACVVYIPISVNGNFFWPRVAKHRGPRNVKVAVLQTLLQKSLQSTQTWFKPDSYLLQTWLKRDSNVVHTWFKRDYLEFLIVISRGLSLKRVSGLFESVSVCY